MSFWLYHFPLLELCALNTFKNIGNSPSHTDTTQYHTRLVGDGTPLMFRCYGDDLNLDLSRVTMYLKCN